MAEDAKKISNHALGRIINLINDPTFSEVPGWRQRVLKSSASKLGVSETQLQAALAPYEKERAAKATSQAGESKKSRLEKAKAVLSQAVGAVKVNLKNIYARVDVSEDGRLTVTAIAEKRQPKA